MTQPSMGQYVGIDFAAFLAAAGQRVPADALKERVGWKDRNQNEHFVSYVEWPYVVRVLNNLHPRWTANITNIVTIKSYAVVSVALTIDGVTRDGIGCGDTERNESGNVVEAAIKGAASDALKRAAVLFGIALELYEEDHHRVEYANNGGGGGGNYQQGNGQGGGQRQYAPAVRPSDPRATTDRDIISTGQFGAVGAICRELNTDGNAESMREYNLPLDSISKKAASYLIEQLKARQGGAAPPPQQPTPAAQHPQMGGPQYQPGTYQPQQQNAGPLNPYQPPQPPPQYNQPQPPPYNPQPGQPPPIPYAPPQYQAPVNPPAPVAAKAAPHISQVTKPRATKTEHMATQQQIDLFKALCTQKNINPLQFVQQQWHDESLALGDLSKVSITTAINYVRDEYRGNDDIPF